MLTAYLTTTTKGTRVVPATERRLDRRGDTAEVTIDTNDPIDQGPSYPAGPLFVMRVNDQGAMTLSVTDATGAQQFIVYDQTGGLRVVPNGTPLTLVRG